MTRKNEKDTLTALLALSADKNNQTGPCVSDEELAMLVEDNMDTEHQQKCMEHLAHCETCYNQWVFLKNEEESHKKNIVPLLSKKSYKYIGSSLALAASVVVFLNVYNPQVVKVVPGPENSVILDEKSDSYRESRSEPAKEIGHDKLQAVEQLETLSAPLIKMQKNSSHGKKSRKVHKKESLKPAVQGQLFESTAPAATAFMRSRTVERKISLTKNEVYRMIVEGCKKKEFDQEYWSDLRVKGTKVLMTPSSDSLLNIQLIELLDGMEQETWQQQCDKISHLLDED